MHYDSHSKHELLFRKYEFGPPRWPCQVDYVKGFGKLGGPNTVNVDLTEGGKQSLETKNILLATGSEVTPLPPVPVDNAQGKIVDSTGALDLKEVKLFGVSKVAGNGSPWSCHRKSINLYSWDSSAMMQYSEVSAVGLKENPRTFRDHK